MIRKAKQSDAERLCQIIVEYFPYTHATIEKVQKRLKNKRFLLYLDELGTTLRGFFELEFQEGECRLNGVAVYPEFRRNGIGKKLLEKAIALAKKRDAGRVYLLVRPDNVEAVSLYEKYGFTTKGVWDKKVDGKKVLEMELTL